MAQSRKKTEPDRHTMPDILFIGKETKLETIVMAGNWFKKYLGEKYAKLVAAVGPSIAQLRNF